MSHLCAPFGLTIMTDHKTGNSGIITTNDTKENGVLLVQSAINSNLFGIHKDVFSIGETAWKGDDEQTPESRFFLRTKELIYQMSKFKKHVKPIVDGFSKEKAVYSGKDSSNQDDLCMCLLISVYFTQKYINNQG
tara:strand:- start:4084 stop:4488 length:405 start_codon:yes stop_codon:yes gene_type:complete